MNVSEILFMAISLALSSQSCHPEGPFQLPDATARGRKRIEQLQKSELNSHSATCTAHLNCPPECTAIAC